MNVVKNSSRIRDAWNCSYPLVSIWYSWICRGTRHVDCYVNDAF